MSGIEGLGEAVTGGMMARAVEPSAGEASGGHGTICLNCGTGLKGDYCHHCGQSGHVHRSLHSFFHDLVHGVFHFEGKIWRTLPMLAFRPGELTRRYIAGERARFVSPIALFLFSVFLMFAVFHLVGGPFTSSTAPVVVRDDAVSDIQEEIGQNVEKLADAREELGEAKAEGRSTAKLDTKIADLQREIQMQRQAMRFAASMTGKQPAKAKAPAETGQIVANDKIDIKTGLTPVDQAIEKANDNPKLLAYKLQSNAYKFSWALIPISVPFLWLLLFWKRQYKLYDHTVFVTYSIAFMSLAVIALSLLRPLGLGGAVAGLAILLIPPLHMYRQLKGAYGLSRGGALWRTFFLLLFSFMAGLFFFIMLLALGAFD